MNEFKLKNINGVEFSAYSNEISKPSGSLCIVHGVGEHFTRYGEMANTLAGRGYNVYGMDLIGHGTSPGSRGYIGARGEFCGQITALLDYAESRYQSLPLFLMGHSLGGLLVLYYRCVTPERGLMGYAVCSPWLGLTHTYSPEDIAEFKRIIENDPYAVHDTQISPSKLFTKEPGRIIPKDDTMHPYIAYKNLIERLEDINTVFKRAGGDGGDVYIFLGSEDPICDTNRSLAFKEMLENRCTVRIWEGLKHEPWNEPNRNEVVNELADWLDGKRVKRNI